MIYFNLLPHREATRALQRDQFNKSLLLAAILAGITAFAIYGAMSTSLDAQHQNQETLGQEIKRFEKEIIEINNLVVVKVILLNNFSPKRLFNKIM